MPDPPYNTFLDVLKICDDFPYGSAVDQYYQLHLPNDDQPHGYMLPEIVHKMPWTPQFQIQHSNPRRVLILDGSRGSDTAQAVTRALQELIDICIQKNLFHVLGAQHSEPFAIVGAQYDGQVQVERYATSLFGLTVRGAHLIAYINTPGGMKIWVSRRAPGLYIWPGKLDSTVGGGIKAGVTPFQTIIEEAEEEASLPQSLVRDHAKPRGAVSHISTTGAEFPGEKGLVVPDYAYVYDMELPQYVIPTPHDDEVSGFYCMTVEEVKTALLNGEFKPDSAAVYVDFLIRHSHITPENEKNFVQVTMRLHRQLPFRIN